MLERLCHECVHVLFERQIDTDTDRLGEVRSAASVAKIPYRDAADGISLTTSLVPIGLGRVADER